MLGFGRRVYARRPRVKVAPTFVPTDLSGTQFWLTADRGITTSSGAVVTWADQAGSGYNPTQATPGLRPTYNAVDPGYNNKPSLSFSSSVGTFLQATGFVTINQPVTIYVVGQSDETSGEYLLSWGDAALANGVALVTLTAPVALYAISQSFAAKSLSTSVKSPGIMCAVINNASTAVYTTNSQVADGTGTSGTSPLTTAVTIGGRQDGNNCVNGKIAAVVMRTGTDSAATRALMYSYFVSQYGFVGFA